MKKILTIDQGTTSSRSIIFDESFNVLSESQKEYPLSYPNDGWVEADANEILLSVKETLNNVLEDDSSLSSIVGCGITNQRESTVVWEKSSGKAIYPVIIWQDRRTGDFCNSLKEDKQIVDMVAQKTGLLLDPYFSATKLKWILGNVAGAKDKAKKGELAFGTIDSFLIWNLTSEQNHLTDVTNASRTLLFNINDLCWDRELLDLFDIPIEILPDVISSDGLFGNLEFKDHSFPITGVLGDQQSALVGQNCFTEGSMKSTYGTGCFLMVNTKQKILHSKSGLLTTIGYKINNEVSYAIEGSIFSAGTIIQWLRDEMNFFIDSKNSEDFLNQDGNANNLFFVPAFTGLGAPQWNPDIRGSYYGITRDTSRNDLVTAAFNSLCYQTKEILDAISDDGLEVLEMSIDGGMANNNSFAQLLSNITQINISIPVNTEATAIGAAKVASVGCGLVKTIEEYISLEKPKEILSQPSEFNNKDFLKWKEYLNTMLKFSDTFTKK
ncbi:MAG: glycerol kinase GlpK [SAR86 cluster bacterium]|uniref:Glycerol kinase GlpK n=1 Tax=SAR86 cluster bacterium TaxID=2030880 RepID=A0A520MAI5_9GAMM|nr:MAG: glycerol kinase GlpK [SAR86 cluster bacterium]